MNENSADNSQNVDNEAPDVATDCLSNSVVLRKIFENLSSPELRQLSFVNKLWKLEAQSVMRKRGHLTAYVKSNGSDRNNQHEEVDAFISDLKQMNPVPFSGISIDIKFGTLCDGSTIEDHDPFQGVILDQPFLKTVSVKLRGCWLQNVDSLGFLFTKKVLQDCSGILEELELNVNKRREFMEKVVQDFAFPHLKILKLMKNHQREDEAVYENYMKAMLSRAPNLKVLHSDRSLNLMLRVLEGSSVLPVHTSRVDAPFHEISCNFDAIRLENVQLFYTGPDFNFDRFNRITPVLLQQSCTTTLRFMRLDAVLAIPLMSFGITLKNVKNLYMDIDYDRLESIDPRILNIVKNFDFTRIFPNSNEVSIAAYQRLTQASPNHVNRIIEQANAVLSEPLKDRAAYVKVLKLRQRILSNEAAHFFAQMFPNIEKLDITTSEYADEEDPFERIWRHWLGLKELNLHGNMRPRAINLDSVFSEIFNEELAELRLKNDEYLNRVNIVPVMPALTCLKNLSVLFLHHKDPRSIPLGDDAAFLFSNVTALVAFARCPTLALSLKFSSYTTWAVPPAMTHLEPYVSISSGHIEDQ